MHDYSLDGHPKEKILFALAFFAITFAPYLHQLVFKAVNYFELATGWSSPAVTAIPVFSLYIGIYMLFDKCLWKLTWMRKLLLVPDINGKWKCDGETVLKNGMQTTSRWAGEVVITQSWSKIMICLKTGSSQSKSVAASLFHEPGIGYRLLYQYQNSPQANELDMSKHSGSAELLVSEDCASANGNYFTDQHRRTVGVLNLERSK